MAKHKGITCLLVDMRTPGIEARPIRTMAGDRGFSELFLTDARIPRSALLGEVDDGWSVATRTLSNERAGVAEPLPQPSGPSSTACSRPPAPARRRRPIDSPVARDALTARYIETRNLELLAKRTPRRGAERPRARARRAA